MYLTERELRRQAIHRHTFHCGRPRVEDQVSGRRLHRGGPGRPAREDRLLEIDVLREQKVRKQYLLDV